VFFYLSLRRSIFRVTNSLLLTLNRPSSPPPIMPTSLESALLSQSKHHIKITIDTHTPLSGKPITFGFTAFYAVQFSALRGLLAGRSTHYEGPNSSSDTAFIASLARSLGWSADGGKSKVWMGTGFFFCLYAFSYGSTVCKIYTRRLTYPLLCFFFFFFFFFFLPVSIAKCNTPPAVDVF
jgi:hypothetical protein